MPSELVCTRPLGQLLLTSSSTVSVLSHRLSTPASDALRCEPPSTAPSTPRSLWFACWAWRFFCSSLIPGGSGLAQRVPRRAVFRCAAPRGAHRRSAVWFRSSLFQCGVSLRLPEGWAACALRPRTPRAVCLECPPPACRLRPACGVRCPRCSKERRGCLAAPGVSPLAAHPCTTDWPIQMGL